MLYIIVPQQLPLDTYRIVKFFEDEEIEQTNYQVAFPERSDAYYNRPEGYLHQYVISNAKESNVFLTTVDENVVLRIRIAVKEGELDAENVIVLHLLSDGDIIQISINADGSFDSTPDGFLDDHFVLLRKVID